MIDQTRNRSLHSETHSRANQELTGYNLIGRLRAMPMMRRLAVLLVLDLASALRAEELPASNLGGTFYAN